MEFHTVGRITGLSIVALLCTFASKTFAYEEDAARVLAQKNYCSTCHAIQKEKGGPAFHRVAEKLRGQPDAEERIVQYITSAGLAKFDDGHVEQHKTVETSPPSDLNQVRNLAQWILAQ